MLFETPPVGGWPGLLIMGIVGWLAYHAARDSSRK
jgi:hypothetical protein